MGSILSASKRLENMGFRRCGQWEMCGNNIEFILTDYDQDQNVLYAFISEGDVKHIGKTVRPLKQRMYGYQNLGLKQSTNIKCNKRILEALEDGETVEIHALSDNGLLYYGGFHVNLAAGLEDSLVKDLARTFGASSNIETFSHVWRLQIPALKTLNINLAIA